MISRLTRNKFGVVDIYVNIEFGESIPDTAFKIQENVKNTVETMTGLEVSIVNVHVQGITFYKEKAEKEEAKAQKKEEAKLAKAAKKEEARLENLINFVELKSKEQNNPPDTDNRSVSGGFYVSGLRLISGPDFSFQLQP